MLILNKNRHGEVSERLIEQHWKCCVRNFRTAGSNPALSVVLASFEQAG
jgi:hypothetical protein